MKSFLTKNQLLLLRLFYTNPEKSFYMQEIAKILGKKAGVFQRTLNALAEEGLAASEYRANARYFRANTKHPLYPEFKKIIAKSAGGIEEGLRKLVDGIKEIKTALLYGSFAKGKEHGESDIDLVLVGQPGIEDKLLEKLPGLEKKIQREINYKLYSEEEFRRKRKGNDPFLKEILSDRNIILKGKPDVI